MHARMQTPPGHANDTNTAHRTKSSPQECAEHSHGFSLSNMVHSMTAPFQLFSSSPLDIRERLASLANHCLTSRSTRATLQCLSALQVTQRFHPRLNRRTHQLRNLRTRHHKTRQLSYGACLIDPTASPQTHFRCRLRFLIFQYLLLHARLRPQNQNRGQRPHKSTTPLQCHP